MPERRAVLAIERLVVAHWGAIAEADFFTTEAWTWCGLLTCYTVVVIDPASRRVKIRGSTHSVLASILSRPFLD